MSDSEKYSAGGGVKNPFKAVLDEARALGNAMALERRRPSAIDIARAYARGFGADRVDVKALMTDPQLARFRTEYGLREKHLRDALKEVRDDERQADREKSGVSVPTRRRNSDANHATDATTTDA